MDNNTDIAAIVETASSEDQMTKVVYLAFVQELITAHGSSQALGAQVMAKVAPFDKELAELFRAVQNAEDRLVAHCQRKLEQLGPKQETPVLQMAGRTWSAVNR